MKRWIPALCACLCLSSVWAGIGKGNGEIGFDFGATAFDDDLTGKAGFLLALRGGYHFTRLFELEIEFSDSAHYDWREPTTEADFRLDSLYLNGVFNFPSSSGRLVPYVLAGFGSARLDIIPFGGPNDTGSAQQVGAGCRFFMGPRAAFRLQVTGIREKSFDFTKDHLNYVAGFTWRLGTET